jgi:hypothetical protein
MSKRKAKKISFEQMPEQIKDNQIQELRGGVQVITVYRIGSYNGATGSYNIDESRYDDTPPPNPPVYYA